MFHLNKINRSNSTRKPIFGVVVALPFVCALNTVNVYAEDAAAFRARVIKEVLEEVPDVELAKQIVEIRVNREFLKKLSSASNPAPKTPAEHRVPIRQPVKGVSDQPAAAVTNASPKVSD
jgi:hypothetical protein